jgi:hypothetical protein
MNLRERGPAKPNLNKQSRRIVLAGFIIGLASVAIFWLTREVEQPHMAETEPLIQGNGIPKAPSALSAPSRKDDPQASLEGVPGGSSIAAAGLTDESKAILNGALRSIQLFEEEKAKVPPKSQARVILNSLERKLFVDDYTLAAFWSPSLDCGKASIAYSNVMKSLRACLKNDER